MKNINLQTLRLFNSIQTDNTHKTNNDVKYLKRTINNGYILDSKIFPNEDLLNDIESIIGLNSKEANSSFHKSWNTIKDADIKTLIVQQLIHYITTYGYEEFDMYDDTTVYVPIEKLKLPKINKDKIKLTLIKALTKNDIKEKIIELAGSGIALKQDTINDIMEIIEFNNYHVSIVPKIKNKELRVKLFKYYDLIPEEPVEWLRYVINKLTGSSLLIKDKKTISMLENVNSNDLDKYLVNSPDNLASIFFRFKPLFLAMKKASKDKTFFNRLRKQANYMHKPLKEDYLNNITKYISNNTFNEHKFIKALNNVNIFRKIRLAYALSYNINTKNDSIVYQIRNGKGWATERNNNINIEKSTEVLNILYKSIVNDIKEKVNDKTFYIPEYISYALPATEKQFVGNIPVGSFIESEKDIVFGVHWFDQYNRVDLDLSCQEKSIKFGWDGNYRDNGFYFSGDMTAAPGPNGASELFFIEKNYLKDKAFIVNLNYFNYRTDDVCPFKFFIGYGNKNQIKSNYMFNVNNNLATIPMKIEEKYIQLGLITKVDKKTRFYFNNTSIGNDISSRDTASLENSRKHMLNKININISLEKLLIKAGARIIKTKKDYKLLNDHNIDFIDISPENLEKSTIINLLI